ncbi:MAG: restriction endonuclease subunit S [Anaerolineaceae bacterium]|nr:restriction endonuclease subunit S [Anaerolineaceae bacterium]
MNNNGIRPLQKDWQFVQLGEVSVINPSRPRIIRVDDAPTTFVPMSVVDGQKGIIASAEQRNFGVVKKGYTYFSERDVLFAKITPCMENGKHAIAVNLIDGIGFGSTEFHVIHPGDQILSEWIHFFLRQPSILKRATGFFSGAVGQQRVPESFLKALVIPIPPLREQRRIVGILKEQLATIERAKDAIDGQLNLVDALVTAYIRQSLFSAQPMRVFLKDCLDEIKKGIGETWKAYPVIGATRTGMAPAKEKVGKNPGRYKLVEPGTIFYNPMRINIGSIGMLDEGDSPGITSPDYVVFKTRNGILHSRWFYYWFRSGYGAAYIKSLARGAVRERMLFNRLITGQTDVPTWEVQYKVAAKLRVTSLIKEQITSQLTTINALPTKILRRAFNGEL